MELGLDGGDAPIHINLTHFLHCIAGHPSEITHQVSQLNNLITYRPIFKVFSLPKSAGKFAMK